MIRKQHQHRWKNRFQKERDKSVGAPDVCFPPESKKTNYFRVENLTRARVSRCFRGVFSSVLILIPVSPTESSANCWGLKQA